MSTDDCSEIGRGPCPCGKGEIVAERCTPDHAYVRASQVFYEAHIECTSCAQTHALFGPDHSNPLRLVLRSDLEKKEVFSKQWYEKLTKIEQSSEFGEVKQKFEIWLSAEESAAAKHRKLSAAGLISGLSLASYRSRGFTLRASDARAAIEALKLDLPALLKLTHEADALWELTRQVPPAIKTGISGLEQ